MKVNMKKILCFSSPKYWTFFAIVFELGILSVNSSASDIPRPHPTNAPDAADSNSSQTHDNSFSSSSFHLDSSSSSLHKIIHHQPYAQPTRTGAFHLHKLFQKLSFHKDTSKSKKHPPSLPLKNSNNGIASTINVKSANNSLLIKNSNDTAASRLKRQLEGIFHVRDTPSTSTVISILPTSSSEESPTYSRKSLFHNHRKRHYGLNNVNKSHQRVNSTKTTKVETRKFPKAFEFSPTEVPNGLLVGHKGKPSLGSSTTTTSPYKRNANNVTVEIIETSRRTVIKHDGVNNHENTPPAEISFDDSLTTPNDQSVPATSLQEESSLLKSTPIFRSLRPRLKIQRRFRQPGQVKSVSESPPEDSKSIEDSPMTSPRPHRKPSKSAVVPKREVIIEDLTRPTVDVKVSSFQEQIPYNDREVSEADLQDYLEGHTTFGAKGNFKHIVSRNITGFIPHHESSSEVKRSSHGVYKRTPQPPLNSEIHSHRKRNSRRDNDKDDVHISQADVKKYRGNNDDNPKMTIYTASGVKYAPSTSDEEDLGKKFYEYSGGKSKNNLKKGRNSEGRQKDGRDAASREDNNNNPFDELYKQGHPGVAKPPQVIYKSHPLGVPYGRVEELDLYENPLRADPLSDDVPLKFDPASDVFYGDPVPDKDKTLAQSNRPAPVRVENKDGEYNNNGDREEGTTTRHPYRDSISKRVGEPDENGRFYPPPSYSEDEGRNRGTSEYGPAGDDRYFKDFVSLDNNFQQLPRPSKEDESFSSLIPPEANDYDDDGRYFGDDDEGYNSREERGRDRGTSTKGYERDDRETTDRNRDRERYSKGSERDDDHGDEKRSRDDRDERRDGSRTSSRRPPSRQGQYDDDGYDDFGANQEDVTPEYFDSSYLKHFDDEIKKLEDNDRRGVSTENPPSTSGTTGEPPLIISSPGPAVSYERSSLPRPTGSTEPPQYEQEQPEEEGQRDEQDKPSTEKDGGGEEEEPEEEGEEVDETPDDTSTTKKDEGDQGGGEEHSDEESQPEKRGVKVIETQEVKRVRQDDKPSNSSAASAKDTGGNIDDDISGIEKEYGGK